MPLTADELKNGIPGEIGDTGIVATNLDSLWAKYDDRPLRLHYLYSKRDAIDMLEGQARQDITIMLPSRARMMLEQLMTNLQTMRQNVQADIDSYSRRRSKPKVGVMSQTAPVMSPPGFPDANSGVYRGDPNTRVRWPR